MATRTQRAGARLTAPIPRRIRNVFTTLDDAGMRSGLDRFPGESTVQFRERVQAVNVRRGAPTAEGVTAALCSYLGLAQERMLRVSTPGSAVVTVSDVSVSLANLDDGRTLSIPLVVPDLDGMWRLRTLAEVAADFPDWAAVSVADPAFAGLPAVLLERQSSRRVVSGELVYPAQVFRIGADLGVRRGRFRILVDEVSFSSSAFARRVSVPAKNGDWTVDADGEVNVFVAPAATCTVTYAANLLGPGLSTYLVGSGAKVVNLSGAEAQGLLLPASGPTAMASDLLRELHEADRTYWGK